MKKQTTQLSYQARLQRVLDYIDTHIDTPLNQDTLSDVACFSKFHFHRIFSALVGMPLYQYIQYVRLKRAAFQLAYDTQLSIIDIALDAGYDSHEAFSRRFKKICNLSPSDFRKTPDWQPWQRKQLITNGENQMKPEMNIKTISPVRLAMVKHRGNPDRVHEAVSTLIEWAKRHHGLLKSGDGYGIAYNDPATTPEADFKFDLGIKIAPSMKVNDADMPDVIEGHIAGGRYAVTRHYGSHDQLGQTIQAVLRNWLPNSGEELRDTPLFFQYQNYATDVPENKLITDIYFPLK